MKIVNINNEEIKGAFQTIHHNCLISVSTITKKTEIAVFCKDTDRLLKDKIPTLPAAYSWVESFGPRD